MTAGRSAGTEQGQGREMFCDGCGHVDFAHADQRGCAASVAGRSCPCERVNFGGRWEPSPSVPPARDSGRDEAREAVARELARHRVYGFSGTEVLCSCPGRRWLSTAEHQQHLADAVAALLRDGTTT